MNPPGVSYYNAPTHWPHGVPQLITPVIGAPYPPEMPQGLRNLDRLHPGISIYGPPATGLSNESQSSIQIQIKPPVGIVAALTLSFSHCIAVSTVVEH